MEKYEERWKKNPRGEGRPLLYLDISRSEKPRPKKSKFKPTKQFKKCRESMEPLSLVEQRIDAWLKDG
ncbi:MAG: hypothetical protein ACJ0DH_05200 [bacterium]